MVICQAPARRKGKEEAKMQKAHNRKNSNNLGHYYTPARNSKKFFSGMRIKKSPSIENLPDPHEVAQHRRGKPGVKQEMQRYINRAVKMQKKTVGVPPGGAGGHPRKRAGGAGAGGRVEE